MIACREKGFWAQTCAFLALHQSPLIQPLARANWLMQNNKYHNQTIKGNIWKYGFQAPLFLPAYSLPWLYKKLGFEKRRCRRLRCQRAKT